MCKGRFLSYAVHSISCVTVYKRIDNGSQLELKHVAMDKLMKLVNFIFMVPCIINLY